MKKIQENSLYFNTKNKNNKISVVKADFIDKPIHKDAFWITILGFLGLLAKYPNVTLLKTYIKNIDKTMVGKITDEAHDLAIVIKTAYDNKEIPLSVTNELTKLLFILKSNSNVTIDPALVLSLMKKIPFVRTVPSDNRVKALVGDYLAEKKSLQEMPALLFPLARVLKTCSDFQMYYRYCSLKKAAIPTIAVDNTPKPTAVVDAPKPKPIAATTTVLPTPPVPVVAVDPRTNGNVAAIDTQKCYELFHEILDPGNKNPYPDKAEFFIASLMLFSANGLNLEYFQQYGKSFHSDKQVTIGAISVAIKYYIMNLGITNKNKAIVDFLTMADPSGLAKFRKSFEEKTGIGFYPEITVEFEKVDFNDFLASFTIGYQAFFEYFKMIILYFVENDQKIFGTPFSEYIRENEHIGKLIITYLLKIEYYTLKSAGFNLKPEATFPESVQPEKLLDLIKVVGINRVMNETSNITILALAQYLMLVHVYKPNSNNVTTLMAILSYLEDRKDNIVPRIYLTSIFDISDGSTKGVMSINNTATLKGINDYIGNITGAPSVAITKRLYPPGSAEYTAQVGKVQVLNAITNLIDRIKIGKASFYDFFDSMKLNFGIKNARELADRIGSDSARDILLRMSNYLTSGNTRRMNQVDKEAAILQLLQFVDINNNPEMMPSFINFLVTMNFLNKSPSDKKFVVDTLESYASASPINTDNVIYNMVSNSSRDVGFGYGGGYYNEKMNLFTEELAPFLKKRESIVAEKMDKIFHEEHMRKDTTNLKHAGIDSSASDDVSILFLKVIYFGITKFDDPRIVNYWPALVEKFKKSEFYVGHLNKGLIYLHCVKTIQGIRKTNISKGNNLVREMANVFDKMFTDKKFKQYIADLFVSDKMRDIKNVIKFASIKNLDDYPNEFDYFDSIMSLIPDKKQVYGGITEMSLYSFICSKFLSMSATPQIVQNDNVDHILNSVFGDKKAFEDHYMNATKNSDEDMELAMFDVKIRRIENIFGSEFKEKWKQNVRETLIAKVKKNKFSGPNQQTVTCDTIMMLSSSNVKHYMDAVVKTDKILDVLNSTNVEVLSNNLRLNEFIETLKNSTEYSEKQKGKLFAQLLEKIGAPPAGAKNRRDFRIVKNIAKRHIVERRIQQIASEVKGGGIRIIADMTPERLHEIMKFNNFDMEDIEMDPVKKKDLSTAYKELLDTMKSDDKVTANLPLSKVKKNDLSQEELDKITLRLDSYSNNNHGDTRAMVLESYDANMDTSEVDEWVKNNPQIVGKPTFPLFHGCGSIAASMISRFGFKIVTKPVGGVTIVGKMLGDGVYVTPVVTKAIQYSSDNGFSRTVGDIGYLFEMEVYLGKQGTHHRSAGMGADNIRSEEHCVFNPRQQIKIKKIYMTKRVEKRVVDDMKRKMKNEQTTSFKDYIKEESILDSMTYPATYMFSDGRVPYNGEIMDFDVFAEKFKDNEKVRVEFSQQGPEITIMTDIEPLAYPAFIPDTDEFVNTDPDGLYTFWKEITKKL